MRTTKEKLERARDRLTLAKSTFTFANKELMEAFAEVTLLEALLEIEEEDETDGTE